MDCVWLSPQCGYYKLERRKVQQKTVFQLESSLSVLNRKSGSGVDSRDSHLEHTSGEKLTSGYMPLESFLEYCKWSIKAESRWFFQEVSEPRRRVRKCDMHLMRVFFLTIKVVRTGYPLDVTPGFYMSNISMLVALQSVEVQSEVSSDRH